MCWGRAEKLAFKQKNTSFLKLKGSFFNSIPEIPGAVWFSIGKPNSRRLEARLSKDTLPGYCTLTFLLRVFFR